MAGILCLHNVQARRTVCSSKAVMVPSSKVLVHRTLPLPAFTCSGAWSRARCQTLLLRLRTYSIQAVSKDTSLANNDPDTNLVSKLIDELVLARKELQAAEAERRKELQAAEAERHKELQAAEAERRKELQAAEAERRKELQSLEAERRNDLKAAEAQRLKDALKLQGVEERLNRSNLQLLKLRGMLSMRGLLEFAEEQLEEQHLDAVNQAKSRYDRLTKLTNQSKQQLVETAQAGNASARKADKAQQGQQKAAESAEAVLQWTQMQVPKRSRRYQLWEAVLKLEPELQECITHCTGWEAGELPAKLEALYSQLSNQLHWNPQQSDATVNLVDTVVSYKDCLALQCVGKAVNVPTSLSSDSSTM